MTDDNRDDQVDSIGTCTICGYHGPGPRHDCGPSPNEFRLPDGARFSAVYSAERVEWSVQLIIPAVHNALANHGDILFVMNGRGLFSTQAKLDRQYRRESGLPQIKRGGKKGGARKGKQL